MAERDEMQPDGVDTWRLLDLFTDRPAEMEGRIGIGLNVDEAGDNSVLINKAEREKHKPSR